MTGTLSTTLLDAFVGLSIEKICPLKWGSVGDVQNHCAHFVGHVLKLNGKAIAGAASCAKMEWATRKSDAGATIRANDIYNASAKLDAPDAAGCLAFYTLPDNIKKDGTMGDHQKKHVGICFNGFVYNYGNTNDKVRKDKVGGLAALYGKTTVTKYTKLPTTANILTLADIQAQAPPADPKKK